MAESAHATYQKRLKEESQRQSEKRQEEADRMILEEFQNEKASNAKLINLNLSATENEKKIKEIMKRKESLQKCHGESLKGIKDADLEIKHLLEQKDKITQNRTEESNKLFRKLLRKKRTVDLDEDDDVIPKKK